MPGQDTTFEVGDEVRLVGLPGLEGMKVTVAKVLAKDKWAVIVDGEDKKSKVVSSKNMEKLGSAAPAKSYSIVGTWDEWEAHEMTWVPSQGCFEYPVIMGSAGTESFKVLMDGDWDLCVYPDRNDANPHEEHKILGPDDGGSDVEWTIGLRREDNAYEGACFKVCLYVFPSGKPKQLKWEAPGAGGGRAQENGTSQRSVNSEAPGAGRTSVKDLLKKGPSQGNNHREEEAPAPARAAPEPPKRSMLPMAMSARKAASEEPAAAPTRGPREAPPRAAEPAQEAAPAAPASGGKPLSTVLREARPQSTPQELAMTKSKLMQIGIKTTEDLLQILQEGRLQESLQAARLTALPPDMVEALTSFFGLPAKAATPAPAAQGRASPAAARAKSAGRPKAAAETKKVLLWEVVGGAESGGLLVRGGPDKASEALSEKIACGAILEEIELSGERLHYKKRSGSGPPQGWILVSLKDKELAKRVKEEKAEPAPAQLEEPPKKEPAAAARGFSARRATPQAEQRPAQQELPLELKQKAQRLEVEVEKLNNQSPEHVAEFLDRLERVQKSTASKLQAQYAELGFPIDEDDMVERAEMARLVSGVLRWQELQLIPLQEVCAKKGLEILMEQPREELLELLCNIEWETAGIPITRIADRDAARSVFSQLRGLENAGPNKLVAECKRLGLPTSSPETMTSQLKQALVWKVLPTHEILRECKAHKLSPSVGDLSSDSTRDDLLEQLVSVVWNNRCDARDIPAKRLGSVQLADELLAKVDRLQVMGPLSLQVEYRKMGVTYDSKLDTQALVDRLRDVLVWESLPLAELQEDCRQRGLAHNDGRKAMLQRLRQRLDHELELEAQGLPVRRLGGYEAAIELMDQYEAIDQMKMEDMVDWYKGTGCPEETGMTKDDFVQLLKVMAVWEALPITELSQECAQNKVVVKDLRQLGSEADQREFLVTKLLQRNRMRVWEERGFNAERIGDFQGVCQVVQQYYHFDSMSNEDLERSYANQGMPKKPDTDRAAMLASLKMVLVWEALPLLELQMDALERSEKIQCDFESKGNENDQRSSLIRQLTVESLRTAYEAIGVPVERIGFLEAYSVGKELVSYTVMGAQELQDECKKLGLTVNPEMTGAELVQRLREYTLWDVLPADDLWAECKKRGIQEQLREQILGLLLAQP